MGIVGSSALLANAASFGMLWRFREGDSNMRSAWICTRNDAPGNVAVLLAAFGVFGTGTGWPDVTVATIMAGLAIQCTRIAVAGGVHVAHALQRCALPAPCVGQPRLQRA